MTPVLEAAVCLVALWPGRDVAALDPLTTVFSRSHGVRVAVMALGAVGLALVYPRFWCRCFCAPGAFLSLLGGVHLLRRLMPPQSLALCEEYSCK